MTGSSAYRWVRRFAGLLIWFVLVVPVGVVVATKIGMQPTHWSGERLADVDLPALARHPATPPEPANALIAQANQADGSDSGDLAPSYWDADKGQVVLGAVTDRGTAARQGLGEVSGAPFRVERRAHSSQELRRLIDAVIPRPDDGAIMSSVDAEDNRVLLTVTRLSQPLFADLAARYGDAVEVQLAPFAPATSPAVSSPAESSAAVSSAGASSPAVSSPSSSWSDRADPLGTWYVLTTGFPWFMGAALVFAIVVWLLVRLRRLDGELPPSPHRIPAPVPAPVAPAVPAPAPAPAPAPTPGKAPVAAPDPAAPALPA